MSWTPAAPNSISIDITVSSSGVVPSNFIGKRIGFAFGWYPDRQCEVERGLWRSSDSKDALKGARGILFCALWNRAEYVSIRWLWVRVPFHRYGTRTIPAGDYLTHGALLIHKAELAIAVCLVDHARKAAIPSSCSSLVHIEDPRTGTVS